MQTDQFLSQLIQLSQLRLKREQPRQAPPKKTDRYAYATAAKGYGYRMALMGFDFTDLEEKRRKFQWWLESQGVDSDKAYDLVTKLNHSWDFAISGPRAGVGKSFLNALDPWLGALDMTPGSVGLKLYDKYREVRTHGLNQDIQTKGAQHGQEETQSGKAQDKAAGREAKEDEVGRTFFLPQDTTCDVQRTAHYGDWNPESHPRGKSTPESTPGSFVGDNRQTTDLPSEETFKQKTWAIGNKEHAMLFDKDGKALAVIRGHKDNVTLHAEELKALNGGRFIHNHPGGSPLSPSDLALGDEANVQTIEAFGVDSQTNERVLWIARRPAEGWPSKSRLMSRYKAMQGVRVLQAREKIKSGEMTVDQATHWATDQICHDVAKAFNIKLERHVIK